MQASTSLLPGKFVWFEHVSADLAKAAAFYGEWLGWHIERMPVGDQVYSMIMNVVHGIGGFRSGGAGLPSRWESYLSVADVDDRFAAAVAAGAKPVVPPMDIGQVGRGASLLDPTGAAFCLWKSRNGDRPDPERTPIGDWYWNELWTPDAAKALAFYESVFGHSHDVMPLGEQGDYFLLKTGEKMRGGITQSSEMTPMWLPYVHVADCDAATARAGELGALEVMIPPTDIPGVGRFSMLIDPFGAPIAVIKSEPMPG